MEENNIEYLSSEAKDILGKKPSWLTTWAFGGIVGILTMLVVAGAVSSYSEIVDGDFVLTTEDPPVSVTAPMTGNLDRLLVAANAEVATGEVLAVFASDAEMGDVLKLEEQIEGMENAEMEVLKKFVPDRTLQLGELAGSYENLLNVFQYIPLSGTSPADENLLFGLRQRNAQLFRSNNAIEIDNDAIRSEIFALEKELNSTRDTYNRTLNEIHSKTMFEINRKIREKEAEITANEAQIQHNLNQIESNKTRMQEIVGQSSSGLESKLFQLKQSVISLKGDLRRWKKQHLVTAPISGKVSFYVELAPKQRLEKDDDMMAIIPANTEEQYIGFAKIPIKGSGLVKDSQEVNIKFLRYPFRQFGVVKGRVKKIFPLPVGDAYSVEIELVNGLKTSTGVDLDFRQQMKGNAEIVTDEKLFIRKVFEKLWE